jgi:hypothetical protein
MSRRWRRCITMIELPATIKSRPPPTVQRRSKPVNGSELAFAGEEVVVGELLAVAGEVVLDDAGVLDDFDGDVPLFGVVVGAGGLVA